MIHPSSKSQDHPTTAGFKMTAAFEDNLVENLLKQGWLDAKDLELAKHYQSRMALKGRNLPITQTLVELDLVDKNLIHQMMLEASLKHEASPHDHPSQIEELVRARTEALQKRYDLLHSALEITKQIIISPTLYEVYQRTCSLITTHFGYTLAGFFTQNNGKRSLSLNYYNPAGEISGVVREISISSSANCGVVSAFQTRRMVLVSYAKDADKPKPDYLLQETHAELNIPVEVDEDILAIFHVQASQPDAFDTDTVNLLQTIIANISPIVQYHHSINRTKEILGTLSTLYQASQGFSQAKTGEDVYRQLIKYLKNLPLKSLILTAEQSLWRPVAWNDSLALHDQLIFALNSNKITIDDFANDLIFQEYLLITKDLQPPGLPDTLYSLVDELGVASLSILPLRVDHQLVALIFLYSETLSLIEESTFQFITSLLDHAAASLQRAKSLESMEKRLSQLEVIDSISRAVSFETDIYKLYRVIHEQITLVMGDVNIIIATYDPETNLIEIPYAYEEKKSLSIPPFDLGEGLTSILIKNRKPLLLVENAEQVAAELGAKIIGVPAKSWLGVPILLGGEPIGAIIVQDLDNEHRFDEEDQGLLSTLSSQVAVSIRNARLIHEAATKANFEKDATEITNMLWSMTDVELIMQTALEQLGKKLNASQGIIRIELDESEISSAPVEAKLR
jgi:GAF domain-containing protein